MGCSISTAWRKCKDDGLVDPEAESNSLQFTLFVRPMKFDAIVPSGPCKPSLRAKAIRFCFRYCAPEECLYFVMKCVECEQEVHELIVGSRHVAHRETYRRNGFRHRQAIALAFALRYLVRGELAKAVDSTSSLIRGSAHSEPSVEALFALRALLDALQGRLHAHFHWLEPIFLSVAKLLCVEQWFPFLCARVCGSCLCPTPWVPESPKSPVVPKTRERCFLQKLDIGSLAMHLETLRDLSWSAIEDGHVVSWYRFCGRFECLMFLDEKLWPEYCKFLRRESPSPPQLPEQVEADTLKRIISVLIFL